MSRRIRLIRRDKLTQAIIPSPSPFRTLERGAKYRRFISFRGHALFDLPLFDQRHSGINNVSSRNHEQWGRVSRFIAPYRWINPIYAGCFSRPPDLLSFQTAWWPILHARARQSFPSSPSGVVRTLTRRWKCRCIERSQIKRRESRI